MELIKTKKYKTSKLFKVSILSLFAFLSLVIVRQQFEIKNMESELCDYNNNIEIQEEYNTVLQYSLLTGSLSGSDYAEEYARNKLDYIKPGERVFVNIGGNTEE